jgi:hypothetical protein
MSFYKDIVEVTGFLNSTSIMDNIGMVELTFMMDIMDFKVSWARQDSGNNVGYSRIYITACVAMSGYLACV